MSSNNSNNNNNNACSNTAASGLVQRNLMSENLDLHISRISARTTPDHISRTLYEMSIADVDYVDIVATKDPETKAVLYYSAFLRLIRWGPERFPATEFDEKKMFKIYLGRYSSDPAEKYWCLYPNKNPLPRTRVNVHQLAASTEKLFENAEQLTATVEMQKTEIEAQKTEIEAQKTEIEAQKSEIEALKCELKRCENKFDARIEAILALLSNSDLAKAVPSYSPNNLLEIPSVQAFPTINSAPLKRSVTIDNGFPRYSSNSRTHPLSIIQPKYKPDYTLWRESMLPADVEFVTSDDEMVDVPTLKRTDSVVHPGMSRSSTLSLSDFANPSNAPGKVLKAHQEQQNNPAYKTV